MPTPWDANFDRPAPPLTIYPQVGPTEQMMHRALRERGLDRPAWDLARRTHTRLVPMEEIAPAGALYVPDTNEIQVGYNADWPIGSAGSRGMYAHELRHARQNESPLPP